MKTQARRCWSCTIAIPRRKRLTPDRRARCPRRSTNSTSFSPAWDQVLRQNDAANPSNKRFRSATERAAFEAFRELSGRDLDRDVAAQARIVRLIHHLQLVARRAVLASYFSNGR